MNTSTSIIKAVILGMIVVAILISTMYIAYLLVPIILLTAIIGGLYLFFNRNKENTTSMFDDSSFRY